jgi:hypothetical protein
MFEAKYPKNMRKNLFFNQHYQDALCKINNSIAATDFTSDFVKDILGK